MCGRYYIAEEDDSEELRKIIDIINRKNNSGDVRTAGEICPADLAPVVANNRKMEPAAFAMKWGYSSQTGKLIINARSETAANKPMFMDGMTQRRCLIPASGYFEWEKRGRDKIKYAFEIEKKRVIYMAGLYRIENGNPVFTILTRTSADRIAFIHDRMPVILPEEAKGDWLNVKYKAEEIIRQAVLDVNAVLV